MVLNYSLPDGVTSAASTGYIEGCFHAYTTADSAFPGLIVGTGFEDYSRRRSGLGRRVETGPRTSTHRSVDTIRIRSYRRPELAIVQPHPPTQPEPQPQRTRNRLNHAQPLAGMVHFDRGAVNESISAYRNHDRDLLIFTDGGSLQWRVGDVRGGQV